MKYTKIFTLVLLLFTLLCLSGASFAAETKEDLIIVTASDMDSFDPTYASNVSNSNIIYMCYNRLYECNSDLSPKPVLVEKFTQISDTVAELKIYGGIKFHDGSEMKAEDVVWSLNRARVKGVGIPLLSSVSDISVVDDYTVRITTKEVFATLTTVLTHVSATILPKAYGEQADASGDWSKPIGSGRYIFDSRLVGDNVKFVLNPDYFDPNDAAKNKSLTFKIVPEGGSRTIMVQTGEADLNINFQTSDYDLVKADESVKLYEEESSTIYYIAMDCTSEYFSNKLVRKAVNYCVDRNAILEAGYDNLGKVNYTYVAPACVGWLDNPGNFTYDVEKARSYMKEAGYPDGFTVNLVVWSDVLERVALVVQAYLADINITAKITRVEANMRMDLDAAKQMPMYVGTWGCYRDPDMFIHRMFGEAALGGTNWTHFTNPELEKLYATAHGIADESKRIPYYEDMQRLLVEESPKCQLFVSNMFALANAKLQGVEISAEAPFNFHKLYY